MNVKNWLGILWLGLTIATGPAFRPTPVHEKNIEVSKAARWRKLADHRLNFERTRDEVMIGDKKERTYSSLRLRVRNGGMTLSKITVYHNTTDMTERNVSHMFGRGTRHLVVDLPGEPRPITRIVFEYSASPGTKEGGMLQVWGK